MKIHTSKNKFLNIVLVGLCVLAVFQRLSKWSHLDTLAGDEGIQLIHAERIFSGGPFPDGGEISGIDKIGNFIMHNSPIGYYFIALVYALGMRSPEGYVFVYILLNIAQAFLLYKTADILFNRRAAWYVLLLALYSTTVLYLSTWASQPTNAIFFESVALYVFARFVQVRKEKYFLWAVLASVFATQFYPPMYLLMPIKILLFILLFFRFRFQLKTLLKIVTGIALIYLPLVLLEINHGWHNVRTLQAYYGSQDVGDVWRQPFTQRLLPYFNHILLLIVKPPMYRSLILSIFMGIVVVLSIYISVSYKHLRTRFMWLSAFIIGPISLVTIMLRQAGFIENRTYLYILIPYVFLFFGLLVGYLRKYEYVAVFIFTATILVYQSFWYIGPNGKASVPELKQVAQAILDSSVDHQQSLSDVDLFAVSRDLSGWDTSIYWYLLEKLSGFRMVEIDFISSQPIRKNMHPASFVFIICYDLDKNFSKLDCRNRFQTGQAGYQNYEGYGFEKNIDFKRLSLILMKKQ